MMGWGWDAKPLRALEEEADQLDAGVRSVYAKTGVDAGKGGFDVGDGDGELGSDKGIRHPVQNEGDDELLAI
jgi:hypothetical protein